MIQTPLSVSNPGREEQRIVMNSTSSRIIAAFLRGFFILWLCDGRSTMRGSSPSSPARRAGETDADARSCPWQASSHGGSCP